MKKTVVQTIENSGNAYGQVSSPNDLMKAQDYAHEHVEQMTKDFLVGSSAEVAGFDYELTVGNGFNLNIKSPGRIYDQTGQQFQVAEDTEIVFEPADDAKSRLDVICAVIADNVPALVTNIPFVRLRTAQEFGNGAAPYPPQNFNQPTERHNTATVVLRTGNAADAPTLPELAANEVPLYVVSISPGATEILSANITDLRNKTASLRQMYNTLDLTRLDLSGLMNRVARLEKIESLPVDLRPVFSGIFSLGEILTDFKNRLDSVRLENPEILTPKLAPTNPASGKLDASGGVDAGAPCINIELGSTVRFGDKEFVLSPGRFQDTSLNARFVQISGGSAHQRLQTQLSLANVVEVDSDGYADFLQRAASLDLGRSRPACCSRGGVGNQPQFVEVFGGLAPNNSSALGDWYSYDLINDTLTPRNFSGDIPVNSDRPALFPYGNGLVLLGCGNSSYEAARWYYIDAATGDSTEIVGSKPTGQFFLGDKINQQFIFIIAVDDKDVHEVTFWLYNVDTHTFEEVGVFGNVPTAPIDYSAGCFYQQGQFVLVEFSPEARASGRTYIFDYATLSWTRLSISAPYMGGADKQLPISGFRMANVSGRPILAGGLLYNESDPEKARFWELKYIAGYGDTDSRRLLWDYFDASFDPLGNVGFCSTLSPAVVSGSPVDPIGKAFMIGGHGKYIKAQRNIYTSVLGGLAATVHNGQPAITLAETATFAEFTVPVYTAPWAVAGYYASLVGQFEKGQVEIAVSFDDGVTFHAVEPDKFLATNDSDNPGKRWLRITLYSQHFKSEAKRPILSLLSETFDQDGATLKTRTVLRYDILPFDDISFTHYALFIDRNGVITLETAVAPSTPDKALLQKITPNGVNAPDVKNYINKRRARIRYSKEVSSGVAASMQTENEFAVPVSWVEVKAHKPDKTLYYVEAPEVEFDEVIEIAGVANGDTWIIELEA